VSFTGDRRLVVFGFGPIGAGLFVYEAFRTGLYAPPVVVDVQASLVEGLRENGGQFSLNVALSDSIVAHGIGPVIPANPLLAEDRERIVAALADAEVAATCLPGTAFYGRGSATSPAQLVAEGLARRRRPEPLVLYAAENAVNAAGILTAAVDAASSGLAATRLDVRDTVIGKMSGVQTDAAVIRRLGLAPLVPAHPSAFLVEAFDAILVSMPAASRSAAAAEAPGFPTFRAVPDLEPFEFAKLYGHNATHALGAFIGVHLGLRLFADLVEVDGAMRLLADAFVLESGAALVGRFAGADPLFTEGGYQAYADDLLARMTNPNLHDSIERAARDPERKLGWDDRLVGTMRVCLRGGIDSPRYALGAAAGLVVLEPAVIDGRVPVGDALRRCWPAGGEEPAEAQRICELTERAIEVLREIVATGRVPHGDRA
jgi:mannitol-1-phosphate 5-dehydrogenase